jgi:hypothetical protein
MGVLSGIILTDFFLVHVFISFFLFPLRRRSPSFDHFEAIAWRGAWSAVAMLVWLPVP